MLLVFGALPPAVLNYVFAERYRQEPDKVASIVMVGNVAALLFIPSLWRSRLSCRRPAGTDVCPCRPG